MSGKGGRLTRRESDSQTLPGVVLDLYSQTVHPFLPLERERERERDTSILYICTFLMWTQMRQ